MAMMTITTGESGIWRLTLGADFLAAATQSGQC